MHMNTGEQKWWLEHRGKQHGPFSTNEVNQMIDSGEISSSHLACHGGDSEWRQLREFAEFPENSLSQTEEVAGSSGTGAVAGGQIVGESTVSTSIPSPPPGLTSGGQGEKKKTKEERYRAACFNVAIDYIALPWYRKSHIMSIFTVAALLGTFCVGLGFLPCLVVCISLLTGDIYYSRPGKDYSMKKWHWANKIAAYLILVGNLMLIAYRVSSAVYAQ